MNGFLRLATLGFSPKSWGLFGLLLLLGWATLALSACNPNPESQLQTIKANNQLVVGVKTDSPPFGFVDEDGQLKGFDVDLMREVTRRLLGPKAQVVFRPVLSSTRILALNTGLVDVVAANMTITPQRQQRVAFSEPYFLAHQALAVLNTSPYQQPNQLQEAHILYTEGSTGASRVLKVLPKAHLIGLGSATEAYEALLAGEAQAMINDDMILKRLAAKDCRLRLLPQFLGDEPYGLAFKKAPESESLRQSVNNLLAQLQADGTLERLETKWLSPALGKKCAG